MAGISPEDHVYRTTFNFNSQTFSDESSVAESSSGVPPRTQQASYQYQRLSSEPITNVGNRQIDGSFLGRSWVR
jgi:hypothetical protein